MRVVVGSVAMRLNAELRCCYHLRHDDGPDPRAALGYLLGSIPFGLLLTRLGRQGRHPRHRLGQYRRDQRAAHRAKGLAAATLLLDALKGDRRGPAGAALTGPTPCQFAAAGALDRPLYPVWLRFTGRQGRRDLARSSLPSLLWQRGGLCAGLARTACSLSGSRRSPAWPRPSARRSARR